MSNKDTRQHIVETADDLFYKQGFEVTSFADIANIVSISRGNFYHHFKTKDGILEPVIERRIAKTKELLDNWDDEAQGPLEKIECFIRILIMNQSKILAYGCPVGTLSSELSRLNHPSKKGAKKLFNLFRIWLKKQFELLGCIEEADELAMHLIGRSQGVATLASAFNDKSFIHKEVDQMCEWLKEQIY